METRNTSAVETVESEPYISVEEYQELNQNAGQIGDAAYAYEYYRGRVYALAGSSLPHAIVAGNIHDVLSPHFRKRGCRSFRGDVQVKTTESYVYPDITVLCGEPQLTDTRPPSLLNPVLLVEVLSPSTESRDRTWKLDEYLALPSLREYWIVSQKEPRVFQYLRENDGWRLEMAAGMDAVLRSRSFEIEIPFAQIYEGVEMEKGQPL